MPTISLLTSNSTTAPITAARGQASAARAASNPCLFLTDTEQKLGVSPTIYDEDKRGREFQLAYRPLTKRLVIFSPSGQEQECYSGLRGVTTSDTTILGTVSLFGTPPTGAVSISPYTPYGLSSTQGVVISPSPADGLQTGITSIGGYVDSSTITSIVPESGDSITHGGTRGVTIAGFRCVANVNSGTLVTAYGSFSANFKSGSIGGSCCLLGGGGSIPPTSVYQTYIRTGGENYTGPDSVEFDVTCVGLEKWVNQSSGQFQAVSIGRNVSPRHNSILIGTNYVPSRSLASDERLVGIFTPGYTPTLPNSGVAIGRRDALSFGDNNSITLGSAAAMRFAINGSGAFSFSSPSAWGTAGQVLSSNGTGGPPVWKSAPSYSFSSADGKQVTVTNGIITSIL